MLNKTAILDASDRPTLTVDVPEWGGKVKVRTLSGIERDGFEASLLQGKKINMHNMRAKLCAVCMVDDKGKRLFNDLDAANLGCKSAKALDRIFTAAQELNGMGTNDIEELAKNSGKISGASLSSD